MFKTYILFLRGNKSLALQPGKNGKSCFKSHIPEIIFLIFWVAFTIILLTKLKIIVSVKCSFFSREYAKQIKTNIF